VVVLGWAYRDWPSPGWQGAEWLELAEGIGIPLLPGGRAISVQ
jgi:hypothetical protein